MKIAYFLTDNEKKNPFTISIKKINEKKNIGSKNIPKVDFPFQGNKAQIQFDEICSIFSQFPFEFDFISVGRNPLSFHFYNDERSEALLVWCWIENQVRRIQTILS